MAAGCPASPMAPVSWGELLDKITILEIKAVRLQAADAQANVLRELTLLRHVAGPALTRSDLAPLIAELRRVNDMLWRVEDDIRAADAAARFDARFIELARAVYRTNDERAALKRRINALLQSDLVEEKSHAAKLAP